MGKKSGARMTGVGSLIETIDDIEDRWLGNVAWETGTNIEYSIYQEFGTSKIPARPYMRPAAEEAKRKLDYFAEKADSIQELVSTVALFIERRAKEIIKEKDIWETGTLHGSIEAKPAGGGEPVASASVDI